MVPLRVYVDGSYGVIRVARIARGRVLRTGSYDNTYCV